MQDRRTRVTRTSLTWGCFRAGGSATSPFGRPLHCEPDLLPEGQFERVAVGVGDPRNITDRFAEIDRGTGRPTLSAGFRAQPVDLLSASAGNAEMPKWPKRRVWPREIRFCKIR